MAYRQLAGEGSVMVRIVVSVAVLWRTVSLLVRVVLWLGLGLV